MPDVRSFRNRLKLKEESARKLAVLDLERVEPAERDQAAAVLIAHLPKEPSRALRRKIIELLLGWNGKDVAAALHEMARSDSPELAGDAKAALDYLATL